MTDEEFKDVMQCYLADIDDLPKAKRAKLLKLADQTRHRHEQIKQSAQQSRDAVDDWRLWMKYFLFDIESSARETPPSDLPRSDSPTPD